MDTNGMEGSASRRKPSKRGTGAHLLLKEYLDKGGPWWKRDTPFVIRAAVLRLERHGVPEGVAVEVVSDIVGQMREEYGE